MTRTTHLTEDQIKILTEMTDFRSYKNGWAMAQWIAENCGHAYDTPWASSKLQGLIRRGFVERGGRGFYRITAAGRAAIEVKP
jgi:predicted transcriptional regulator